MTGQTRTAFASAARRSVGRPPRGMTLFEMLVILLLLGVIVGIVLLTSVTNRTSYMSADAALHVQQQARQALAEMERELHQAGGTITPAVNQLDFQMNLGYNQIAPCPANAVCWGGRDQAGAAQAGWGIRYRLDGVQLLREIVDAGGTVQPGTRVLANDVTTLAFTYSGAVAPKTVTVQLQVQRVSSQLPGGSVSVAPTPLTAAITLRTS